MKTLLALAAALAVCAAPALAQTTTPRIDRPAPDCGASDPETTGSLPTDPRRLGSFADRPDGAEALAPEEPWQERAEEDAELRRERLVMCGVD
jgi:hypothetical protein